MQLNEKTLKFIEGCITGDSGITAYKTGGEIVEYFNKFGFDDTYEQGFPSRRYYVSQKLTEINGTEKITDVILDIFHPINFIGNDDYNEILESLNKYLFYDGYEFLISGKNVEFKKIINHNVEIQAQELFDDSFISDQYSKCHGKLVDGDFYGALTNSRSLLEASFAHIFYKLNGYLLEKTGDLKEDYKKIKDDLDLTIHTQSNDALKALCGSISTVITSIDTLSNSMGDRHRPVIQPRDYQARFVVESSISLVNYIYGIFKYNLSTIEEIFELLRILFDKSNIYRYTLDVTNKEQFNEIHAHHIVISLKEKLTAFKAKEVINYLLYDISITSREGSGRFFGTMIVLIDYLKKTDVEKIFDETIVSQNEQARHLRWFLTNVFDHKPNLLNEEIKSRVIVMNTINVYTLFDLYTGICREESIISKIIEIGKGGFIANLLDSRLKLKDNTHLKKIISQLNIASITNSIL